MRRLVPLLAIFLSCTAGRMPSPAVPKLEAAARASRVVFVSFDGMGADAFARLCSNCAGFQSLTRDGLRVERVVPVTPSASSSAHVAMLTGAAPDITGIVGNRFHLPGTPWTQVAEGFTTPIGAETIVEVARRNGKRVGAIAFPTLDGKSPRRTADFYLEYVPFTVPPQMVHLKRSDFAPVDQGSGLRAGSVSFSPIVRATLGWAVPGVASRDVEVVAFDTTDDRVSNYDRLSIVAANEVVPRDAKGWFPVSARHEGVLYGSWSKLLRHDDQLEDVTIYLGAIARNSAQPAAFRALVDEEAGFWPTPGDEASVAKWLQGGDGIDAETFAEQADRFTDYLTRVTTLATTRMQFDLLLAYQPIIDQSEHQFLIENDRQRNATPRNRAAGLQVRRRAMAAADRAASAIAGTLDFSADALVITGDHGLVPVEVELRLPTLLTQVGAAEWVAFANGNVAHLYRKGGEDNSAEVRRRIEATGYFDRVLLRTPAMHRHNGDIVLLATPHVALTTRPGPLTEQPWYYGQHGGLGTTPAFHTLLIARGAGIPPSRVSEIHQTDIAPFLASLLGIEPPGAIVATP